MNKPIYSIDAPDQARLKIARAEIEAILRKHDLGGVVVLHTPGMVEFFHDVRPSYSCAWIDDAKQAICFKSDAADYGGDTQLQLADQAATSNLFHALADQLAHAARMFHQVSVVVDSAACAKHTPARLVKDPAEGRRH